MKINFKSYVDDNLVAFETTSEAISNGISFIDETEKNTKIKIYTKNDRIYLERVGKVEQLITFVEGKITDCSYKNNDGLFFNFKVKTLSAKLTNEYFFFSYELIFEENVVSKHKIIGKITK